MSPYRIINPPALGTPHGWNNGMLTEPGGRVLFVAGQTARDASGTVPPLGFVEQFGRALENVLAVVREAGGQPEHIGRLTIYVTDMAAYRAGLKPLGEVYRGLMGKHYPAMALLQVAGLVDPRALVEIEATAVMPS
jgi:enamine deaminase RidA (YjgF/YER057c/UK114 family)